MMTGEPCTIAREDDVEIGMIGLGRMGMNMARRLMAGGHPVQILSTGKRGNDASGR
jgi:3-hydroxyisobutyrate dehydrogenase-like beta-hydroxyacid dehydrogenase